MYSFSYGPRNKSSKIFKRKFLTSEINNEVSKDDNVIEFLKEQYSDFISLINQQHNEVEIKEQQSKTKNLNLPSSNPIIEKDLLKKHFKSKVGFRKKLRKETQNVREQDDEEEEEEELKHEEKKNEMESQDKLLIIEQLSKWMIDKNVEKFLSTLCTISSTDVRLISKDLPFSSLSQDFLLELCTAIFQQNDSSNFSISYSHSFFVVHQSFFPLLVQLETSPSRVLFSCFLLISTHNPKLLIESLFLPLLFSGKQLRTPQSELVNRIIKDFPLVDDSKFLLEQMLSINLTLQFSTYQNNTSFEFKGLEWNEGLLDIIQTIISQNINFDNLPQLLLKTFQLIVELFSKSKKFGTLLLTIVSKHGHNIQKDVEEWKALVEKTETFLKKPTLLALNKLKS